MGNMFDNLGKGLNDFTKQAGKIAGNIGDTAGKITKDVAKGAGKIVNDAGKLAGDAGKMTAAVAGSVAQSAAVASGEVSKAADSMAKGTVSIAKNVKDSADKVDLFNSKLRAKAVEDYNNAVERYENVADDLAKSTQALYDLRKIAIVHVKYVEQHINQLANTPKEFAVELHKINTEVTTFENKEDEIKEAEKQAKAAEGGSGAGATLSALGIAVATMGPTAAMGVATTFGVASTGTAISALSGAAANSAALAWLGGGALAAGGGGMAAGSTFLALAGPVGWTIAGLSIIASGLMFFKTKGDKERLEDIYTRISNRDVKSYELAIVELSERIKRIIDETGKLGAAIKKIETFGTDYSQMTEEQQYELGAYVNLMEASTMLLVNPILGLQSKFSEQDFEKLCASENLLEFYFKAHKNMVISMANLLYEITLDGKDKKLLAKSLRKNKEFLASVQMTKKEFDVDDLSMVERALNHRYKTQRY